MHTFIYDWLMPLGLLLLMLLGWYGLFRLTYTPPPPPPPPKVYGPSYRGGCSQVRDEDRYYPRRRHKEPWEL